MVFKDRTEAANKLFPFIKKAPELKDAGVIVVSMLRGGVVLGDILAKKLKAKHLGLVVTKIPAPFNPELGIGAVCFDITYLEKEVVDHLELAKSEIANQVVVAEHKFLDYCRRLGIEEKDFEVLKGKNVVLIDDGIATGASAKAAALFSKSKKAKKVFLAAPIGPRDLNLEGFDGSFILTKDPNFKAVSQYYNHFPQIDDNEVKKLLDS